MTRAPLYFPHLTGPAFRKHFKQLGLFRMQIVTRPQKTGPILGNSTHRQRLGSLMIRQSVKAHGLRFRQHKWDASCPQSIFE